MRTIVKGKNFDVPDHIRRYAERKLGRLERILDDRSDAMVELSVEQHRSAEDSHIVEVTLVIDGKNYVVIQDVGRTSFVDYIALELS